MNETQRAFLEQLALRIPTLFEAISRGNVKSEYIIGVRRLGKRQVRLKLVAEVVEPGQQSPLHTHSILRSVDVVDHAGSHSPADLSNREVDVTHRNHRGQAASKRRSPRKR